MNFLKTININTRLSVLFNTILISIFFLIGLFLYQSEKNKILKNTEKLMVNEIKELNSIIESQSNRENKRINTSLKTLHFIYQEYGKIEEKNIEREIEVVNINSLESQDIKIKKWELNSEDLFRNASLTQQVNVITGAYISVLQKIPDGYIFITSNIPENLNGARVFYLPNTSKIVYTIEKGEIFSGNIQILNNVYKISARPIYIDGKIQGMLSVAYNVGFSQEVNSFFSSKTYFENGYPFVADIEGNVIIHPVSEGDKISNTAFFKKMKKAKTNEQIIHFKYLWPENRKGKQKYMHVKYNHELEYYIATSYDEENMLLVINKLKINIILAILLSSISIIVVVYLIINTLIVRIKKVNERIKSISNGELPNPTTIKLHDEIGELNTNLNKLIENRIKLNEFTANLKIQNLKFDYVQVNKNDDVENNLVELKNNLISNQEIERKRKAEDKIEQWKTEGLSKFINILRFQNTEIEILAYSVISNLVNYIGATQGGFFVLDKNKNGDKYLELVACYAYDKQKIIEKRIPADAGLIGRVVIEQSFLHITEIPDNYIKITSSLGASEPESLIIIPLIFNNKVQGVMEIASFNKFEKHHIRFVEVIAESITSTISSIKNTKRTEDLLKQSQNQSALMEKQKEELLENVSQLERLKEDSETREIEMQSIVKAIETTALIVELDTKGKIISTNDKFANSLKQKKENIVGKYHKDFTAMNINSPEYANFWEDLRAGKSKKFVESLSVENKPIWLSQNFTPILGKNKKVYKILNIAIDITENKYLERQLRAQVKEISREGRTIRKEQRKIKKERIQMKEAEDKFVSFNKKINIGFIQMELSSNGIIYKVNKKGLKTINIDADKLIGEDFKNIVTENNKEEFQNSLDLLQTKDYLEKIIEIKRGDDKIIKLKIILHQMIDEKTRIRKILLFATRLN